MTGGNTSCSSVMVAQVILFLRLFIWIFRSLTLIDFTERCLSYDEKPLLLFQKLKDANKNPVFMLRHIKDIRSPISVAQQKQTQRQRDLAATPATPGGSRPGTAQSAAYSRNTRLHQPTILHPISAQAQAAQSAETAGHVDEPSPHPDINQSLAASPGSGMTFAIAIYPYVSEQDDEFDVNV